MMRPSSQQRNSIAFASFYPKYFRIRHSALERMFSSDLADTVIALQFPHFQFTENMQSHGHSFEELVDIYNGLQRNKNSNISAKLQTFLGAANITIPTGFDTVDFLKRRGKQFIETGKSSKRIMELKSQLKSMMKQINLGDRDGVSPRILENQPNSDITNYSKAIAAYLDKFFTNLPDFEAEEKYGPNFYPYGEPIGHLDPNNVLWVSSINNNNDSNIDQ